MNENIAIVCFGHEWDSWKRRSNRILSGLSQDPNVAYIIFFERPLTFRQIFSYLNNKASFTIKERCKRFFSRGQISKVAKKIYIITPIIPVVYLKVRWFQIANEKLRYYQQLFLYWLISRKLNLGREKVILWFNRPEFNSGFLMSIRHDKALYDCTEDYTELLKMEPPNLNSKFALEDELLTRKSSLVTVVTNDLYKNKMKINKNTYHISNGVDYKEFSEKSSNGQSECFRKQTKPFIGFVGIINYRHDLEILLEMALQHNGWSIMLIGHQSESVYWRIRTSELSNIHFLNGLCADELPLVINKFDVCLSLLKNNYLNSTGSSMKIYQYLASGKPIVAYPVSDAELFRDVIYLAENHDDYLKKTELALSEMPDDPKVSKRKEYAKANDWANKVKKFKKLVVPL